MRILDLFCCAGGAAVGYHRAGFEVVGVDIAPQPRYPFEFHQADAVAFLERGGASGGQFAAVHASPPCQAHTRGRVLQGRTDHQRIVLHRTRQLLVQTGLPYVIENVEGAPLVRPVRFCGTHYGLGSGRFELRRHRLFEANWPIVGTPCRHRGRSMAVFGHGSNADFARRNGQPLTIEMMREAMGIDWMNRNELSEAIPPRYAESIGLQLRDHLAAAYHEQHG